MVAQNPRMFGFFWRDCTYSAPRGATKGENLNHLVAHKRILVGHNFELYPKGKRILFSQIRELQDLFQLSIQQGFWTLSSLGMTIQEPCYPNTLV